VKNFWLIVPASDVEDRTLAVTAIRPNIKAMRIVRVEKELEGNVGRFGAMSSNSWDGRR
jgi:hypothetical protein